MSKQLILSAGVSVLAMLGFAFTVGPAAAGDTAGGTSRLEAIGSACSEKIGSELLPALLPALQ